MDAEQIVREVAGRPPPIDGQFKECAYCHCKTNGMVVDLMTKPERHKRDCPYRQAREWIAAHGG